MLCQHASWLTTSLCDAVSLFNIASFFPLSSSDGERGVLLELPALCIEKGSLIRIRHCEFEHLRRFFGLWHVQLALCRFARAHALRFPPATAPFAAATRNGPALSITLFDNTQPPWNRRSRPLLAPANTSLAPNRCHCPGTARRFQPHPAAVQHLPILAHSRARSRFVIL